MFGHPKSVLSNNGREFDNEKLKRLGKKLNENCYGYKAESRWSIGVNERHNGLVGKMAEKLIEDDRGLDQAVCWAISAKNTMAIFKGFIW